MRRPAAALPSDADKFGYAYQAKLRIQVTVSHVYLHVVPHRQRSQA